MTTGRINQIINLSFMQGMCTIQAPNDCYLCIGINPQR